MISSGTHALSRLFVKLSNYVAPEGALQGTTQNKFYFFAQETFYLPGAVAKK